MDASVLVFPPITCTYGYLPLNSRRVQLSTRNLACLY
jgi:hypothetical protein